ncbi:MAG: hypothetical protein KJN99_11840 [Marinicaulis sp.]|nr:hypothetical protein [Marinicaulis sp.]
MSEALPDSNSAETVNEAELDSVALSALLSSRVCHDLINPVGAIGSGLDVLDDPDMEGGMRDAAMDLIRSGAGKAIDLLSYARLAYGAAGGYGAQISLEEAKKVLEGVYRHTKAELTWGLGTELAPKEAVKVLLILAYAAADSAPRGGNVEISGKISDFRIHVTGKRVMIQDGLVNALGGDFNDLAPKYTPALIAAKIVAETGGKMIIQREEKSVTFQASFDLGA